MNDTAQPTVPAQTPPQQPTAMPSTKEREPMARPAESVPDVKQAIPEIAIPDELEAIGIEAGQQHNPVISAEAKKAGVTLAKPVQNVPTEPAAGLQITLPMTYNAAENVVEQKQYKFTEGFKWLAAEIAYQWRRINPALYNVKKFKEDQKK